MKITKHLGFNFSCRKNPTWKIKMQQAHETTGKQRFSTAYLAAAFLTQNGIPVKNNSFLGKKSSHWELP